MITGVNKLDKKLSEYEPVNNVTYSQFYVTFIIISRFTFI
jgi:hypothetical protein